LRGSLSFGTSETASQFLTPEKAGSSPAGHDHQVNAIVMVIRTRGCRLFPPMKPQRSTSQLPLVPTVLPSMNSSDDQERWVNSQSRSATETQSKARRREQRFSCGSRADRPLATGLSTKSNTDGITNLANRSLFACNPIGPDSETVPAPGDANQTGGAERSTGAGRGWALPGRA
jgi:hypothetical protein